MALVRLQKALADAGVASRRRGEEIIAQGRVTVDGEIVTEMGVKVDPDRQDIRCDGSPVRVAKRVYYLLNKPVGVVCTTANPYGRRMAVDLIPEAPANVYTVGRLDVDTEGLIIITNDGGFAQSVAHPKNSVPKVYVAWVAGAMGDSVPKGLMKGVMLDGHRCQAIDARILEREPHATLVRITMAEGRNREVRGMLKKLNHPVKSLQRIAIGAVADDKLRPGQWRALKDKEIEQLLSYSSRQRRRGRPGAKPRRASAGRASGQRPRDKRTQKRPRRAGSGPT